MKSLKSRFEIEKEKFLRECVLCGACQKNCPIFPYSSYRDQDPIGLQQMKIDFLKEGTLKGEVYDMAYTCTLCESCGELCPAGLDPCLLTEIIRAELANCGKKAPEIIKIALPHEEKNMFDLLTSAQITPSQVPWITEVPYAPKNTETVLFTGCLGRCLPHITLTTVDIFAKMGLNFITLAGGKYCCSDTTMVDGNPEGSEKLARELIDAVEAFQPERVVFCCLDCNFRLEKIFPFIPHSAQFQYLVPFLAENLENLKFIQPQKKKVTLHDPCHLRRGLGDYDSPRKLLSAIPGVELVEMPHSREKSLCCGGVTQIFVPQVTEQLNQIRLNEAQQVEADLLIEICLGCHLAFCGKDQSYPFEIENIVTFVGRAMGIEHENKFRKYKICSDLQCVKPEIEDCLQGWGKSFEDVEGELAMFFG